MRLKEEEYTDREGNLRKRRQRILEFPSFWDYDYYYFCAIEQAELEGKHMAVLKCRQRGYSFKGGSMLVRNYMLIPGSKNFAIASEQKFLIGDGLLTKAWQIMDFLDKHTAWAKQRLVSTRMERTSGYKITDEFGKQTEQGYLSSITGITLKNDPERVRGTRAKLVLWEEGGKFPSLLDAWRIEQPSVETDDGKAFGLMIAFGTGGTEGASFEGLKELFYKPKSYNVLSFHNIWDEGRENTECAFFVPAYSNLESFDDDGN
nr:MAG: Terminase [Bacteriophage sp.]